MQYRKARLDEVQEVAQVCADAFEDYPLSFNDCQ